MTLDNEARTRLVRDWLRSTLKQSEFCAAHGISARALREWVRRFGGDRPEARAVAIIDDAIERLRVLRDALVAEQACRVSIADDPEQEPEADDEERHADSERPTPAEAPQPADDANRVRPIPMPAPGYPWL